MCLLCKQILWNVALNHRKRKIAFIIDEQVEGAEAALVNDMEANMS